jgi:DNA-directed RNA polymerase subunit RPC12/RpoP
MYSEQIESLIHLAIVDGELTEKEKQILFKKAAAEGIDLDEFEMVLNAKLFEKQRTEKSTIPSVDAPKSTKLGDVKKCPACGAITKPFHIKCAECGHEFSNIDANVSISKLFEMLNACD